MSVYFENYAMLRLTTKNDVQESIVNRSTTDKEKYN